MSMAVTERECRL